MKNLVKRNSLIYRSLRRLAHFLYRLRRTFAPARVRVIRLENQTLDKGLIEIMETDGKYNNVISDLIAFTGLSREQVVERLLRKPHTHFKSEFRWHAPKNDSELTWFYRAGYGYLFANAIHPYWDLLDLLKPENGPVLDYGGGVGNNALTLAERGFQVDYLEISIIQQMFVRFRAEQREMRTLSILEPFVKGKLNHIDCVKRIYGTIILQDVLEHIPDYHLLLRHLIEHLRIGGHIFENSPFVAQGLETDVHLAASIPLEEAMKGMRQLELGIWQKVE